MKIVLQRVDGAKVVVDENIVGQIGKGYLVFLGIAKDDTVEMIEKAVDKIAKLRIFADENGKTNLNATAVDGEVLVVSQFTLMADLGQNRPSFSNAAPAELANNLYEHFLSSCRGKFAKIQSGQFAAHMHVYAENDGPFTITMDY
ncbi:MAG: D-aminoacyl-tRNA deacylase [Anaerovoracaceae bacterium]